MVLVTYINPVLFLRCMELLKQVLAEIKPTKEEEKEVNEKISEFLKKLNKNLKDAKAVLGGSGAKGTWISHTYDADIFVQFNYNKYKDKSNELSDVLEKVLKRLFSKLSRLHGSRDYFQVKQVGFTFEVIPILKITKAKDALNITDVSPLHAEWVKKHKKFADEIRLAKQFCKAQSVYGAESYIKGFSGYMCEILTIHCKGFMNLAKAAAKWEPKTVIDTEGYYKNKSDVLFNINKSKQQGPMVLIDPVQKDRNAAAALSEEKFNQFVYACKEFLKNPSKDFFKITEVSIEELKKRAKKDKLILLAAKALSGKSDIVGSKLLKAVEFIDTELKKNGFNVYEHGWKWDKAKDALFWFIVDKNLLPEHVENRGPPLNLEKHVELFKKKHKKTFVKGKNIWAKDKREFRDAGKFVNKLIKDKYLEDKAKEIRKF